MTFVPLQDRLSRLVRQGCDVLTGAVRAWSGAVEQVTGAVSDPTTVVHAYFDVAEEVLRIQRTAALDVLRIARRGGTER